MCSPLYLADRERVLRRSSYEQTFVTAQPLRSWLQVLQHVGAERRPAQDFDRSSVHPDDPENQWDDEFVCSSRSATGFDTLSMKPFLEGNASS